MIMQVTPAGISRPHRLVRFAFIFGIWTLVGCFMVSQAYVAGAGTNRLIDWRRLNKFILLELPFAYLWALLTPLLVRFCRRFPLRTRVWPRNLILHICTSLFLAVFTMIGIYSFRHYLFAAPGSHLNLTTFLESVYGAFDYYILVYWLILMMTHAVDYYGSYREEELKSSELKTQLAQAQLQALKMQLHPHFLFNTLHSIAELQREDVKAANKMLVRLGDFLRLTLENSGADEVSLQEELEFLKCYLEIESIRFQDRLTVNMKIDPQTLDAQVPNLILQPIVENAIKHAIAPRASPGFIDISADQNNGTLNLLVQDNGVGLRNGATSGKGVGLANTRSRLERLYGTSFRLELVNIPEGGLRVHLVIPFKLTTRKPGDKE